MPNETRHTHSPSPWAVERNVKAGNVIHLAVTARQNGKDWMVCSVTPEAWARPIDLANAQLIAAAPELLEALERCRDAIQGYKDTNKLADDSVLNKALILAKAARAKATGKP